MSSFFNKFRSNKKKGQNNNSPYADGSNSNTSSQASLASRSQNSLPLGRGNNPALGPQNTYPYKAPRSPKRGGDAQKTFASPGGAQPNAFGQQQGFRNTQQQQQYQQQLQQQQQQMQQHQQLQQQQQAQQQAQQQVQQQAQQQAASGQPTPLFLKQPFVRSALVKGSFQTIVELPRYVDLNEWLALNLFEFNSNVAQFVSLVSDYIDDSHKMSAGPGFDYLWIDTNKQAVRLPAITYIDYTMSWIQSKFDDPALFPTKQGVPFPPSFGVAVKSIYVQLFRIFAYLVHNHYDKIVHLGLESHFNSLFCHFASFGKTFNLLDRNEMAPLLPLITAFEAQGKIA